MVWGITNAGFVRKTFDEIKSDMETSWLNKFGQDQDLSVNSPNSILLSIPALMIDELWQVAEDCYNSLNKNSAEGVSLNNTVGLSGIEQLQASASIANVSFKGANSTVIPAFTQLKQNNTDLIFETISESKIISNSCNCIQLQINSIANSTAYRVYIDGEVYSYISDSSATYAEIITGLKTAIETASLGLNVVDEGSGLMTIQANDYDDSYDIAGSSLLTIFKVQSIIEASCTVNGANEVPANSIATALQSLAGVDSVNNFTAGQVGRDKETEQELRLRAQTDKSVVGFNFTDAIKAKIIDEVLGVSYCRVYENDTESIDSNSIDPKSWEAIIEGGTNSQITKTLSLMKVAGMSLYGSESAVINDNDGIPHTIKFTRPDNAYLWVKITINSYNSEENFPVNGDIAIKQSILNFVKNKKFNIGDIIVSQKFLSAVFDISGVGSATIEIAQTSTIDGTPSYSTSNINLSIRQKPVFDLTRISVVL
jgi:uncharacterized phage protein gp47/JayE